MSMASGASKKNDPNKANAKWAESRHINERSTKNAPKSNTKDRRASATKSLSSTSNDILLPGSARSDMPSSNERLLSGNATMPSNISKLLPGTKQNFLPATENSLLSSQNESMLPGSCKSLPSTSKRKASGSGHDGDVNINAIPASKSYQTQQDIVQNNASTKSPTKSVAGGTKDKKKKVSKPVTYESVDEELEATIGQDNKSFDSSEASKQESWSLELLNNSITALKEAANREDHVTIDFSNINDITSDSAAYAPLKSYQQRHILKQGFPSAPYQRIDHPADQNLCSSFIASILYLICALIVFCPIMAIIIICVPISGLIKKICGCCCCCAKERACICCCSLHLSDLELLWLHSSPLNAAVSQSLIVLERGLSTFKVRELVHSRLITAENKRGHRLYPRFTQKIASFFSGYSWIWDNDFIVENHVFSMPSNIKNEEELQDYISEMASKPLPSDRPMWEIHVLQNYGVARDTILLFRIHPCVTDGITLVRILFSSIVDNQPPFKLKPRFARKSLFINSFRAFFMGPIVFLGKWIFTSRDFNFLHGDHVHLSGKKVVSWSEFYSLSKVTRIKQVTRSTFNDVLLSVAVGCIRSYLQVSGIANPFNMQCCIPVDISKDSGEVKMGSRYILVPMPLPTNTEGSIPQLWETKHLMEILKCSSDVISLNAALHVTSTILPELLSKKIWSTVYNKCTCMIANLPGPESILSFGSKEIKSIVYWLPAVDQMALSISFFTYADQVRMSVIADRSVLPNPELITRDFNFQVRLIKYALILV